MLGMRLRRAKRRSSHALHPAAIVAICLAAAIGSTVITGNLLKLWLDDETYRKYTEGEPQAPSVDDGYQANVRKINAYPFVLGEEIEPVIGTPAVSVPMNQINGKVCYSSEVAAYLGLEQTANIALQETVSELSAYVNYISGIFHPQAFSQTTSDLLYTAAAEEAALLREFLRVGGNEVLLCELPLSMERIDALKTYLKAVKAAIGQSPVGVAVPLSVAAAEDGWEIISALLQVCDFCALDLRGETVTDKEPVEGGISPAAQELLSKAAYYQTQYDMRVLISEEQTALLSTLEIQMHPNYQVVSE